MPQTTLNIKPISIKDLLESALDGNDTVVIAQCLLVHGLRILLTQQIIKRLFAIAHLNGLYSMTEASHIRELGEIAYAMEARHG